MKQYRSVTAVRKYLHTKIKWECPKELTGRLRFKSFGLQKQLNSPTLSKLNLIEFIDAMAPSLHAVINAAVDPDRSTLEVPYTGLQLHIIETDLGAEIHPKVKKAFFVELPTFAECYQDKFPPKMCKQNGKRQLKNHKATAQFAALKFFQGAGGVAAIKILEVSVVAFFLFINDTIAAAIGWLVQSLTAEIESIDDLVLGAAEIEMQARRAARRIVGQEITGFSPAVLGLAEQIEQGATLLHEPLDLLASRRRDIRGRSGAGNAEEAAGKLGLERLNQCLASEALRKCRGDLTGLDRGVVAKPPAAASETREAREAREEESERGAGE